MIAVIVNISKGTILTHNLWLTRLISNYWFTITVNSYVSGWIPSEVTRLAAVHEDGTPFPPVGYI